MALSDFQVFNDETFKIAMEGLDQQVELFNAATNNALILSSKPFAGDFEIQAFFARLQGLVRRRNPYTMGAVSPIHLTMLAEAMVKVGAGTPPVELEPSMFAWIQQNPNEAAAMVGKQLAEEMLKDMFHIAVGSIKAALSGVSEVTYDGTAGVLSYASLNLAQAKFGDAYQDIALWLMHSKPIFDIYGANITNASSLFSYGTLNVQRDPFGRLLIITDEPALVTSTTYHTLGLVPGAAMIATQDDFFQNIETMNGFENIKRTIQSEWSYGVSVKGFTWDRTNGGKAPTTSALLTASNWDRIAESHKNLAGILVNSD